MGQPMECHLFPFHGESLYLGLGLRVFFGNSGVCKARMFESVENEEGEDRGGQEVPWAAEVVPEPPCPCGVWYVPRVSGMCFLRLPLTRFQPLMCPEEVPVPPWRLQ